MTTAFAWDIPDDVLALRDVQLAWRLGAPDGITISAKTTVLDYDSDVMIARLKDQNGKPGIAVGLRPEDWPIGKALPALSHPAIDQLKLKNVALVVTDQEARVPSADLSEAARAFYQEVYQSDEFELVLTPGLNLIAAFPIEEMAADDPLKKLFDRLGFQSGVVLLQGTLGKSLAAVGTGAGTLDLIKDILLRASLPKMRPPDSPTWFKSGQLALEITGHPSIGFVGEITVDIEGDILTFSVAAKIQKAGVGVEVALVGGLKAEEPWVHPLDLTWLIFYKTVLKLSVDVKANIGLGFAAKMIVGEKDIDVAVGLKVNASGAITNFLFDGESAAGVSLADLVALQAGMRKGQQLLPGKPPPPALPLDQLPPMEIKDIHLKFALKDDPDLEVERGFALKGELWIQMRQGAPMTNFAGVDFSLDDNGIVAKAHLGAYAIGPVSWDDALLDLELTLARQNLTISGAADLGIARQHVDVSITRKGAFFTTETNLLDRFKARLDGEAPFTIHDPVWSVRGEMDNDFNGAIQNLALDRLRAWAEDHERAMAAARAANEEAQEAADRAAQRLADLEASLNERQAEAKAAMESAQRARDAAAKAEDRAEAALRSAQQTLEATPLRNVKQKAERKAAAVRAQADLAARKVALTAKQADFAAKKAIYDALSSDAVEAAKRSAREAADAARAAEQRLEETQAMVAGIRDGKGTPVVIDRAWFQGRLDAMQGGTVNLHLDLRLMDRPRSVALEWGFDRLEDGAGRLIELLVPTR
jgi:hypothetical protein